MGLFRSLISGISGQKRIDINLKAVQGEAPKLTIAKLIAKLTSFKYLVGRSMGILGS
jgi:hypothetical protein